MGTIEGSKDGSDDGDVEGVMDGMLDGRVDGDIVGVGALPRSKKINSSVTPIEKAPQRTLQHLIRTRHRAFSKSERLILSSFPRVLPIMDTSSLVT